MKAAGRRSALARAVFLGAAALLLAGCENDAASFQIEGSSDNAITLIREQRWLWERESEVFAVVARYPQCQRRHALNRMPVGDARAELFQLGPRSYLLRNGAYWYAIDQPSCALEQVAEPQAAGTPLGAFDREGKRLRFIAAQAAAR